MRTPFLLLAAVAVAAFMPAGAARAADLDGSDPVVGAAEAQRLYERANDYVSGIHEGQYSYEYLQFYWKRAEANVDRAERVYPNSETAKQLAAGRLKLGPYTLDYFRDRVLYRLEEKHLGAGDQVTCPIFLYGLDPKRADLQRNLALASILETLSRQQRWGEVLAFPVLDSQLALKRRTIFMVAARYDQKAMVDRLFASVAPVQQEAAGFWPLYAEAQALLGKPRASITTLVQKHPEAAVRSAVLHGMVLREVLIRRMQTLHVSIQTTISATHFTLLNLSVRDDIEAAAERLFPGDSAAAEPSLAIYHAALGREPQRSAPEEAHLAYQQALADSGKLDAAVAYAARFGLGADRRRACALQAIELLAEAGQVEKAESERKAFANPKTPDGDQAALAEFRGRCESTDAQLTVRENTFAELPIADGCVLAQAIGEWSLSPNQSIRGAAPWDAVVFRYSPGFENLPPPASKDVRNAASTLKPY